MGAQGFSFTISATNQGAFERSFNALVREDQYENGHDPYSGTIGQKSGYTMLHSGESTYQEKIPVSPSELERLREENEGAKWGPAVACPVAVMKEVSATTKTKKIKSESTYACKKKLKETTKARKGCEVTIKIQSVTKIKDAQYKLRKVGSPKEWRVVNGYGHSHFSSKTKKEALEQYKIRLLAGERVQLIFVDQEWERVQTHQPEFEVEYTVFQRKKTKKISHYEVWGWAAC